MKRAKIQNTFVGEITSKLSVDKVAACKERMERRMVEKMEARKKIESQRMQQEEEKFWFQQAERAFGESSWASEAEVTVVRSMMRKRIIAFSEFYQTSRHRRCRNSKPGESDL